MALPSGCHKVCRPRRSKPRIFNPRRLTGIVKRVCEDFGEEETRAAVAEGLSGCGDAIKLPCKLVDALIHTVDVWNDIVGPFYDWFVWMIDTWEKVVVVAERFGVRLKSIPTPDKVLGILADIRGGEIRHELLQIKAASGCQGFQTGGSM